MDKTLFQKIADKEIPADMVYEDDLCVAFRDITPVAPTHILLVPRKPLRDVAAATPEDAALLAHLMLKVGEIARAEGLTEGGFRTVIADVAWLRAFHFWETRDAVACLKFAELAMTLAPEQFFFLENAANYIAFDFPVWEIRRRGGTRQVPAPVRREIHRKAMNEALRLLENAAERMPDDPRVFVLAAQISAMKTDTIYGAVDFGKTAAYYRNACERPGAPLFAFATYAKFAAEHLPAERGNAEAFLARCRDAAESAEEKRFFEALLAEYFGGENQPPHKSSSSAESRAELSVPASENGASQRTNK